MEDTINEILNRIGEVIGKIGDISQTVIQETSNSGLYYTGMGLGLFLIGFLMFLSAPILSKYLKINSDTYVLLVAPGAIFSFVGITTILVNLQYWIAPTRQVVYEMMNKIW